jgi:hypothetical protein
MDWYWQKKGSKARRSRSIQFSAVVLPVLGAIIPVAVHFLIAFGHADQLRSVDTGILASLFVGIAASLIGLDRAFGYSSGWARYVLTATSIRKSLQESGWIGPHCLQKRVQPRARIKWRLSFSERRIYCRGRGDGAPGNKGLVDRVSEQYCPNR